MRPEVSSLKKLDLPPELNLILSCLRITPYEKEVQQIEILSKTEISWSNFLKWVDLHRVTPLVYTNLCRYAGKTVPAAVLGELRSRFESNVRKALANATELVRLSKRFQQNDIPVLSLKGIVLALQVYGNLALRHSGDIDLLVAPRHVEAADRLLRADYQKTVPSRLTPRQHQRFLRLMHHFEYLDDRTNLHIELHWRPFHYQSSHVMDLTQLSNRASTLAVGGSTLPALSLPDNVLYLCGHGGFHFWHRLFWLVDLAEIIRGNPEIDWQQLITLARESGMMRPLAQGLILAHELLDVPLPEAIRPFAYHDQKVSYSVRVAYRFMLCPLPEQVPLSLSLQRCICRIIGMNSLPEGLNILQEFFLGAEWQTTPLPESLFFLHYIFRVPFWLQRRLGRSRNKMDNYKTCLIND